MKLPKNVLRPKLSELELTAILENLEKGITCAFKDQHYETAASLLDEERKYREQQEVALNPLKQEKMVVLKINAKTGSTIS